MTDNVGAGPTSACGHVFHRVDRGQFVLLGSTPPVRAPIDPGPVPEPVQRREPRSDRVARPLRELTWRFETYAEVYDREVPFVRAGQYERHRVTIDRRRRHASIDAALDDGGLLALLHETIRAWGIGRQASRLLPLREFTDQLRGQRDRLRILDGHRIEDDGAVELGSVVWDAMANLGIVENEALIVATSKTLHHLFPDLVPPLDRAWTGKFFEWSPIEMQRQQRRIFIPAWAALARVAAVAQPSRLVGPGWRTSATKLIDNAIIGLLKSEPPVCPACGSPDAAVILRGLVGSDHVIDAADHGEVAIGGCSVVVDEPMATHRCNACDQEFRA